MFDTPSLVYMIIRLDWSPFILQAAKLYLFVCLPLSLWWNLHFYCESSERSVGSHRRGNLFTLPRYLFPAMYLEIKRIKICKEEIVGSLCQISNIVMFVSSENMFRLISDRFSWRDDKPLKHVDKMFLSLLLFRQ